jgi:hypothetical protein
MQKLHGIKSVTASMIAASAVAVSLALPPNAHSLMAFQVRWALSADTAFSATGQETNIAYRDDYFKYLKMLDDDADVFASLFTKWNMFVFGEDRSDGETENQSGEDFVAGDQPASRAEQDKRTELLLAAREGHG